MTVTNLPAFVTHNVATSDFTIDQVFDLSLIGEYVVTIRSEICVPDDYTQTACTTMADEYQFSIFVQPCVVSTYTATTSVTEIRYNIGSSAVLNDGFYKFDENPACGYAETVSLTNLPTFVTHNEL